MIVVLLVAVILAVVGSAAVLVGTREAGTAGARNMRVQALAAAEAGLAHFQRLAHPSMMQEAYYIGGAGETDADYRWLPEIPGRNGEMLQARYRVRGVGGGPLPHTGQAIVEGQVLSGGRVVGRAELAVVLQSGGTLGEAGTNQEDHSETGDAADGANNNTSISLMGAEFDGGAE